MHIVMVDDDETLVRMMAVWFDRAGHEVVPFTQFEAAKLYLASHTPDVLVTDVRLGAFNGLQLAVQATIDHPDLTAIVLTGFDDPVLHEEATAIGAYYLIKPIRSDQLMACINRPRPPQN